MMCITGWNLVHNFAFRHEIEKTSKSALCFLFAQGTSVDGNFHMQNTTEELKMQFAEEELPAS